MTAGPGRRISVLDIVGMPEDQAQLALEKQGFDWGTPERVYSDTVPAGSIVPCQPKTSRKVGFGQAAAAIVFQDVETKIVPDIVRKTRDQATATITAAGLIPGNVTGEYFTDVESDRVISCDPKAGRIIKHTEKISLVISRDKESVTIPDVTGMSEDETKKVLEDAELKKSRVSKDCPDSVAKGNIVPSSSIAGASGYHKDDPAGLTASKGSEKATVPDVTGKSQDEAKKILKGARLKVRVNKRLGGPSGTVRPTDPAPSSSVKPDSKVTTNIF